ncbi:MAG: tyrosinase family protein [Pirellulaceae bacterium]|nr:tyrosinase family protein [Pirellulaceae bacterium]
MCRFFFVAWMGVSIGMMVPTAVFGDVQVEIHVNGRGPGGVNDVTDDYVTWNTTLCEARVTGLPAGSGPFSAYIINDPAVDQIVAASLPTAIPAQGANNPARYAGGRVCFAEEPASGWPINTTATIESITLTLPANGDFVKFRIAGQFGRPSYNDKDAKLRVHQNDSNGAVVGTHSLMVRVRKNANRLHDFEVKRFLDAMREYKDVMASRSFDENANIHKRSFDGGDEAHSGGSYQPSFLSWHRAFLLQIERDLQTINNGEFRAVTLPYWNWDEATPRIWADWFLGAPAAHNVFSARPILFHPDNPLDGWIAPSGGQIVRRVTRIFDVNRRPPGNGGVFVPALKPDPLASPSILLSVVYGSNAAGALDLAGPLEGSVHNPAHSLNCAGGQIQSGDSADDPLFYLLHCQIDREWAAWQNFRNRFGKSADDYEMGDGASYVQGTSTSQYGSHLEDELWPWDQTGGANADPLKTRPTPLGGQFATSPIRNIWPPAQAKPKNEDMIDYEGRANPALSLGFCYDDVPFQRGVALGATGPLFRVRAGATQTVGNGFNVTVESIDASGNIQTGFVGRVRLVQEGGTFGIMSPANAGVFINGTASIDDDFHDFVSADAGVHEFSVVAHTTELIPRFKAFALSGGLQGESNAITVNP